MSIVAHYLKALGLWTLGLAVFFVLAGVTGPGAQGVGWLARLPALVAFALALGSLPAGIAVSRKALHPARDRWSRVGTLAFVTLLASVVMFLAVTRWAPAALAAGAVAGPGGDPEVAQLTNGELRALVPAALAAAEAAGPGRIDDWRRINVIAWELDRRSAHATLPFLLAWVGVFAAHFAARAGRREVRLAMLWGLGLFVVVTLYLAGENGYELVVLRSAGPSFFAAWFIVFVPGALFGTLGWVTAMDLLGSDESAA